MPLLWPRVRLLLFLTGLLALLTWAPEARAEQVPVLVVSGLELEAWADRGAVGLLVPGAGPETSREQALAGLVRGKTRNSLRGALPTGRDLIEVSTVDLAAVRLSGEGPLILLELPPGGAMRNDVRYPIVVVGAGYQGLLTSDSTRIPGLVSVADVAATALGLDGKLGSRFDPEPLAELAGLDRRIGENGDVRLPAALLGAVLILALSLLRPRAAALGFATLLAANLALGWAGVSALWAVLLVMGLAVAGGAPLLALVLRSQLAVGLALAAVLAAYLVSMGVDASSVALSPGGPSQAGRFYGVSNLLEATLLFPALAGAALVRDRLGWAGFGAVALLALVTIAGSRFGADGGGAIVLAVSYAVLAVGLAGARARVLVPALAGAAAVVVAVLALDAATGGSSHVTSAAGSGAGGLVSDFGDRLVIAFERTIAGPAAILGFVAGAVALAAFLLLLFRRNLPRAERALPLALASAVLVSLVVNDSPGDVVLAGLVGCIAAERCKLAPRCAAPPS